MKLSWFENIRTYARSLFEKHSMPRWGVFVNDVLTTLATFIFAYFLRFNFDTGAFEFNTVLEQSLVVIAVYATLELLFKSFSGMIRHTNIRDIFKVLISNTLAMMVLIIVVTTARYSGWNERYDIPLSILLIHYILATALFFFFRILVKMSYELISIKPQNQKNVIIYGAGNLGLIVKNVIYSDPSNVYRVIAFLDNNRNLQSKSLEGIPVYNPERLKRDYLTRQNIKTMIFAIKKISASRRSVIYNFAVDMGLEVLEVPAVNTWLKGELKLNELRRIKLEDLLGREPIRLNMKTIADGLYGRTILVTGAAGSIGSEIVRQLIRFSIGDLILIDNAETPMFQLGNELKKYCDIEKVSIILADVTDRIRMECIFREKRPEIIFHAAAYKHVPLSEENPQETIRVNVGSTMLLTRLSHKYGVRKFVMISTDKSVNPTNVMGASKRICEMILQARSKESATTTQFVITRFGNVLGSNGSVIPIFRKQIEERGPITVTHPEITRFFMTIPEACQLVLEAGFMGKGGEIFIFNMGKPVKIVDLARQMINLSGYIPDVDIKIDFTGLRPGEKLHEELYSPNERRLATHNPSIYIAEVESLDHQVVLAQVEELLYYAPSMTELEVIRLLREIVPAYSSTNFRYSL